MLSRSSLPVMVTVIVVSDCVRDSAVPVPLSNRPAGSTNEPLIAVSETAPPVAASTWPERPRG